MKKLLKAIVSIVLSLTFIFSYLNLMTNEVSANSATVTNSISEGVIYTANGYEDPYVFIPSKSGYYCFESEEWGSVERKVVEYDDYYDETYEYYETVDWENIVPIKYDEFITDPVRSSYYLCEGESYYVNYEEEVDFSVREITRWVRLNKNAELIQANLDETFTLSLTTTSTVAVDNISYTWVDIPNDPEYHSPSVTLSLSQLLDDNNEFIYAYDDNDEGDFGRGFVSCYVEITYQGKDYGWYVTFDIVGYESRMSMVCSAYDVEDSYEMGLGYSDYLDFDYAWELFEIATEQPEDTSVSYQWCKVDTAKKLSGNYTNESELYTPLKGETSSKLVWSKSLIKSLGSPYFADFDENDSIYHEVVCVVTFTNGECSITRIVEYRIIYSVGVHFDGLDCFDIERGSEVTFPADALNENGVPGKFNEDYLPDGITYKYSWFDCGTIPEYMGYGFGGSDPNDIDISSLIADVTYKGTGKEITLDTTYLTMFTIEYEDRYEYVSYVACLAQPMYKGHICHGSNFNVQIEIFELHYGTFKFSSWSSSAEVNIGERLNLIVDVESIGPVTYQWQKQLDEGWINIYSSTYDTNEYWLDVEEDSFGLYRCAVTDEYFNTIYSEPCVVTLYDGPVITCEPTDFYGFVGDTAKFTVAVEGEGLTYQWQLKKGNSWADQASGGANTPTFSVKVNESRFGKTYRCKITDQNGHEIFSNEVMIIEKEVAIVIDQQPVDCTAVVGTTAKFSVAATGEGLTYQWQLKKGNSWANQSSGGATTPNFSVKAEMSRNGKVYRCLITAANGDQIATDPVTLTVKEPSITITQQPSDLSVLVGSKATFTVAAEGEGLTYQWQLKKGSSWSNQNSGGATTPTFSVNADLSRNGKTYRCLITNAEGEQIATNSVTLTVKEPSNSIIITKQPTDASTTEGGSVGFIVEAEGEGLTYQWQLKKGSSWSDLHSGGATTNWLSLGKCDLSKNGKTYRCVITDVNGEQAVTNEVKVTVWYEMPSAVPAVKSAAPAVADDAVADTVTEPDPETVNEASADSATQAPAPVEAPADPPAEAPVEEPAEETA